jgi:tetratricopeptide (TPR) repeat protein
MGRFLALLACASLLLGQHGLVDRAWDLAAKGDRDQAIRVLRGAIQNDPRDADARLLLGSLLTEAGQQSEAIAQLTEAVRLRPQSAKAQNALGEAYNSFGDVKAAREPFEKAVAIDPGFGAAQVNLGLVLLTAGELEPAANHLDRAIKILGRGDDAAYAHYLRAKVYTAHDQAQKAAAQLQQAVSMRFDFPEAWSDLGEARKTLLDDAGALAAFEHAVKLAPGDAVAQYRLGAEYLDADKPHAALEHLEQAYRLSPDDQSTLNALQRALRQDGRTKEADNIKQKLSELLRKKDEANQNALAAADLNNEGARLQKTGDLRGALKKYQAAVELAPENVPMRVNYAIALLRLGQWTEGLNELHDALLRDPANGKIQEALKEALAQAPAGTVPDWNRR